MNKYKRFVCCIVIIESLLVFLCNGLYIYQKSSDTAGLYHVEAKRVAAEIEEQNLTEEDIGAMDLSGYETIVGVRAFQGDEVCNGEYMVEKINGKLYRIEYRQTNNYEALFLLMGSCLL